MPLKLFKALALLHDGGHTTRQMILYGSGNGNEAFHFIIKCVENEMKVYKEEYTMEESMGY